VEKMPNLRDLIPEVLEEEFSELGQPAYRGRQVLEWLYPKCADSFELMTNLPQELRRELAGRYSIVLPEKKSEQLSRDGTRKYLFGLPDGEAIETVLIPEPNRLTLCVSSQVGCRFGCAFCLTGAHGFRRNLAPHEIVGQVIAVQKLLGGTGSVRQLVLMGMGEPLDNFENLVVALKIFTHQRGLAFPLRRITLSTVGIAPMIEKLGREVPVNLAVSLNAADDRTRSQLMPVAKKYPMAELLAACRRYPLQRRQFLTFEYVLIAGVNDTDADALKLAKLLKPLKAKVNLIGMNPHFGSQLKPPAEAVELRFREILKQHGLHAFRRQSRGADILAACGQLKGALHRKGREVK
jgi:23S rRNA (adenine2503-C2)-methyltransferase